jgi:probable F420-dependent oxidoreductase
VKVETGIPIDDLRKVPAAAQEAEAIGFDGVVTPETQHDPFFPLLIAAEHTQKLGIASTVAIAFPRSPMVVANIAWDLQQFSGGRFCLGLGSQVKGHNQRRFSVEWKPPAPRMREYVLSLRAIFDTWQNGTPLNFKGEHYNFTLMTPNFAPPPIDNPKIPIMIAAVNEAMIRVAGEVCDGLRMHGFNSPKYTREVIIPNLKKGAERSGRSLADFEICGSGFIATGENEAELRKSIDGVKRQISFYGSTRTYHNVFELHNQMDLGMQLHELSLKGKWDEMFAAVPDDVVYDMGTVADHDHVVDELKKTYGGIVDRIGFSIPVRNQGDRERMQEMLKQLHEVKRPAEPVLA